MTATTCHTCGAPHASHGIGNSHTGYRWYCQPHFARLPEGQAMFQRMIGEAADA